MINLSKLDFFRKFRPKLFHKIDSWCIVFSAERQSEMERTQPVNPLLRHGSKQDSVSNLNQKVEVGRA
jgi:hypothetical protein